MAFGNPQALFSFATSPRDAFRIKADPGDIGTLLQFCFGQARRCIEKTETRRPVSVNATIVEWKSPLILVSLPALALRKLRITVEEPLATLTDCQNTFLQDLVSPFINLFRLEVDYTVLEPDDSRIKGDAFYDPEYLRPGDFRGKGFCGDGDSSCGTSGIQNSDDAEPLTRELGTKGPLVKLSGHEGSNADLSGTFKFGAQDSSADNANADESDNDECGLLHLLTTCTVVSFQLKVSVPRAKMTPEGPHRGYGYSALKQHHMILQQVYMPNLRHVHLTYDFESSNFSDNAVIGDMLSKVGMQVWPELQTLKVCATYEVDPRYDGTLNVVRRPLPRTATRLLQAGLTHDTGGLSARLYGSICPSPLAWTRHHHTAVRPGSYHGRGTILSARVHSRIPRPASIGSMSRCYASPQMASIEDCSSRNYLSRSQSRITCLCPVALSGGMRASWSLLAQRDDPSK